MKYAAAFIMLALSFPSYGAWIDNIVNKSTFRIAEEYGSSGAATCFLVEGYHNDVFVVTCGHVLRNNEHETVDIFNFFERDEVNKYGSKIFRIPVLSHRGPLWTEPQCGDIAVFDSHMSADDWKRDLGLEVLIQVSNLMSVEEVMRTTNRTFYAYGFPQGKNGILIKQETKIRFTHIDRIQLSPQKEGDNCGYVFDGNYRIEDTVGGLSGSPVYNDDGIAGIISGALVEEPKSTFVPAEYIVEAIQKISR